MITPLTAPETPSWEAIVAGHTASAGIARHTPMLSASSLSERYGGTIALKAENLQRTGSFKLRGVLNKLRTMPRGSQGVVAGSAGNHAQSLAYAARANHLRCEVFMPVDAAVSKVVAVETFGAIVHREGSSVDECIDLARSLAEARGYEFIHPFDDMDIVTGQAGVGLELVADVPQLGAVVVPIGGGGLGCGVAIAVKHRLPHVRVIGVQARGCAPFTEAFRSGERLAVDSGPTLADGIAVKRPGGITLRLAQRWLDDVVTVDEESIAEAMVLLVERSKLVVEGAGAASLAAILSGKIRPAEDAVTVVVLSGGNVDVGVLATVAARHETRAGRRIRLFTRVGDRPGGLSDLLAAVAKAKGNVIQLEHVRDGVTLDSGETGVELTLEIRDAEHAERLVAAVSADGYDVQRAHS